MQTFLTMCATLPPSHKIIFIFGEDHGGDGLKKSPRPKQVRGVIQVRAWLADLDDFNLIRAAGGLDSHFFAAVAA
jgi:hypothetical protein